MFRRSSIRYGSTPVPVTPYDKGMAEWSERTGSALAQARNWRRGFFGMLLLSCGLAGGLIWQSVRGTVIPWVVEVDKLGQVMAVGPAGSAYRATDPIIARDLADFIWEVRSIPADPSVVRRNWLTAYAFVNEKGHAALDNYARSDDPFSKVGHEQVEVDVESVVRASDSSFQVIWRERHIRDGGIAETQRWRAFLTVEINPPTDPTRFKVNPLGVWVDAINWSKELS